MRTNANVVPNEARGAVRPVCAALRGRDAGAARSHRDDRELIRCPDCAGSEPPPDLPPLVETTAPIEQRFARFTAKREWMPYRDSD